MRQDFGSLAPFDNPSLLHHQHLVRDRPGDRQVVRDEQEGDAEPLVQLGEQVEDLGADRDVERRDGLVGHHQPWPRDDGARDRQALALTAGEFVRVFLQVGRKQADLVQGVFGHGAAFGFVRLPVEQVYGFSHQPFSILARVEGAVGVLEDNLQVAACSVQRSLVAAGDALAHEGHAAGCRLVECQDDAGEGGFSAAERPISDGLGGWMRAKRRYLWWGAHRTDAAASSRG